MREAVHWEKCGENFAFFPKIDNYFLLKFAKNLIFQRK